MVILPNSLTGGLRGVQPIAAGIFCEYNGPAHHEARECPQYTVDRFVKPTSKTVTAVANDVVQATAAKR